MSTAERFELNFGDQMIVGADKSGSMQETDCPDGTSRWNYMKETMRAFIKDAAKYDPDGVSFYFFADKVHPYPDVPSVEKIDEIISKLSPGGGTNTAQVIKDAYAEHKRKGNEQTFFMLFTDGQPTTGHTPEKDVEQAIIDITNDVKDQMEFRIAILTVGERSTQLNEWLANLDDNLSGAKHDIVAIHKLEEVNFEQAIEDAISGHAVKHDD